LLPDRPTTPFDKLIAVCQTDEKWIQFKLKGWRAYLVEHPRGRPDEIKNIEFLISYYENGGSLPARGTVRWVRDSQFVEGFLDTDGWKVQTIDTGWGGPHQFAA